MKSVIQTTAKDAAEAIRRLGLPENEPVRILIGTRSGAYRRFLESANRMRESADRAGLTQADHDELLRSIKTDR